MEVTPASEMPQGTMLPKRSAKQHVEGEAVHGGPARDPHADGADLAFRPALGGGEPDAGAALDPHRPDAVAVEQRHDRGLEATHVVDDAHAVGELHDRVADELPGPVVGDLAAAVGGDGGGAVLGVVRRLRASPRGIDGRVLQQDDVPGPGAVGDVGVHLALVVPRLLVVGGAPLLAQPAVLERQHFADATPPRSWGAW